MDLFFSVFRSLAIKFLIIIQILLCSCGYTQDVEWIEAQIAEELSTVPRIARSDLRHYFRSLCSSNVQALYCKINNNTIKWQLTPVSDGWRNPWIFNYFQYLSNRFSLPNVELILITEDGVEKAMLLPVFAFSKEEPASNVLLFPDFEMLAELLDPQREWISLTHNYSKQFPWENKIAKAFFRGASTGRFNLTAPDFNNDRVRVVLFGKHHPDMVDATFNVVFQPPLQSLLDSLQIARGFVPIDKHFQYKYLLDIDGNASTYSRGRWILLSNSTLVKIMSSHRQWYYKAMRPWVHFVPIKNDLSDFESTLHFLMANDGLARQIADNGTALGKVIFSREVVDSYIIKLLFAYAELLQRSL